MMSEVNQTASSRRDFLKGTGSAVAATTLLAGTATYANAGEDNTIRVALVGCGGRGSGAALNALQQENGPIKLVAMADVFESKLRGSYANLKKEAGDFVDVPDDQRFFGFDGYRKAMDSLRPGDVVILTTPPAFRWVHFTYAIEKGLHVFMEKPLSVDGPTARRMFKLADRASEKNLKVGVGLMCRHCDARRELFDRLQAGEIGDIQLLKAYRMTGPVATEFSGPKPDGISEMMYQIQRFHSFLWASGGLFSDFLIHNIDECCWMKDSWPVKAKGSGGRHYRGNKIDQNFDTYSVEYTFDDGTELLLNGRSMGGCHNEFASYAVGTKGLAVISTAGHTPSKCRIYDGFQMKKEKLRWRFARPEPNPYELEWVHLIDAIRNDTPYNEVERGTMASLVTCMGRMAAHTGQIVTLDDMLNCKHDFAPDVDKLTFDSPAPVQLAANGKYPIPLPGLNGFREY